MLLFSEPDGVILDYSTLCMGRCNYQVLKFVLHSTMFLLSSSLDAQMNKYNVVQIIQSLLFISLFQVSQPHLRCESKLVTFLIQFRRSDTTQSAFHLSKRFQPSKDNLMCSLKGNFPPEEIHLIVSQSIHTIRSSLLLIYFDIEFVDT